MPNAYFLPSGTMFFASCWLKKSIMAKYGKSAQKHVEKAMHEKKRGQLKSGRSGKTVTSRKQAIAIGLSEAREKGAKVPSPKRSRKSPTAKNRPAKKRTSRKSSSRSKAKSKR
jgi:hypothetical protein